jgi:hypothetical protein
MKRLFVMSFCLFFAGCSSSLRESMIRNQRPEYLKDYKGGPISSLTQKDIEEAIEFGKLNKHKQDVINYAFIVQKDASSFFENGFRHLYVLICTNYYLIADYAAKQERSYEKIDMDYVNSLASLPTFHIELIELNGSGTTYYILTQPKFILLKEGTKLPESENNPLIKGQSPYTTFHLNGAQSNWQEMANDAVQQSIEMANKVAKAYQKDLKIDSVAVDKPIHIYDYKNLSADSKYEIVVLYDNKEIRVPIDFSNFK